MRQRLGSIVAAAPVAVTDAVVVGLAVWTLLYHAALPLRARPSQLFLAWAVVCAALLALTVIRRRRVAAPAAEAADATEAAETEQPATPVDPRRRRTLTLVAIGAAAAAAAAMAFLKSDPAWWLTVALGVVAVLAALAAAGTSYRVLPWIPQTTPLQGVLVALSAAALALLSLPIARNSKDDVFYIGKAVWVGERDEVPLRDFLFSEGVLPVSSGSPPLTSIETFQGALGRLLGFHVTSVISFLLVPILTVIAVYAVWRLAQRWAPRRPILVFGVAVSYLVLVVGGDAALGTYHIPRMHEGKGFFVSAMIPLAWVYLTDLMESWSRRTLVLLIALSIASVGLSSAAIMLLPMLAGAAAVMFALAGRLRAGIAVFLALVIYPMGTGIVSTLLMGGVQAAAAESQFFDGRDSLARTVLVGVLGVVGGFALWAGPLLVRRGAPRLLVIGSVAVLTVLLIPGVLETMHAATGLGPVLWRVPWIVPLPVLIGLLVAVPLAWLRRPEGGPRRFGLPNPVAIGLTAALLAVFALAGTPMWSQDSHVSVAKGPTWKMPAVRKTMAFWILEQDNRPPGVLLAPTTLMRTMPMVTSRLRVAMARDMYLIDYDVNSQFAKDRLLLGEFADGRKVSLDDVRAALPRVGVTVVCVAPSSTNAVDAAPALGLTEYASRSGNGALRCYRTADAPMS